MKPTEIFIRWMIRDDMPMVLAIERRSFEYEWSDEDFMDALRQRNCIGMVAERNDRVVGFMIYMLEKSALRVVNFAVDTSARRTGVGTAMVHKLKCKLSQQRRTRITLDVRESNLGAQLFFRSQGLRAERVIAGHYEDTDEDAYSFGYDLPIACEFEPETSHDRVI